MLFRLFRGNLSFGWVLLILAFTAAKIFVRFHSMERNQAEHRINQMSPAMHMMKPETLMKSDWIFSGALGDFKLHFLSDGVLEANNNGDVWAGTWSISDLILTMSVPTATSATTLRGFFRDSSNIVSGVDSEWTATRVE